MTTVSVHRNAPVRVVSRARIAWFGDSISLGEIAPLRGDA
jgi:hypothetical protein